MILNSKILSNLLRIKFVKLFFSIKDFLKNPLVPIKFKELVLKSVVINKVSYIAPLLGSNKINTNNIQKLINLGLYWIGVFSKKKNSFISLYNISKDLNIPPMSAKCTLAQCRCYTKWENSKWIIGKLNEFKVNIKENIYGQHSQDVLLPELRIVRKNMVIILNNITGKEMLKNHQLNQFLIRRFYLNILQIFWNWKLSIQI